MNVILSEAKELVGRVCSVQYVDRNGTELEVTSKIYDATYVPLYGGYLVTAKEDIRFDRIRSVCAVEQGAASINATTTAMERVAA